MPLPPWPSPEPPSDRAQALLGGEVVLCPPVAGSLWQVGFASSFELVFRQEGRLRRTARTATSSAVLLWGHLRCAALNAALGTDLDLFVRTARPALAPEGTPPAVTPVDVWDRRRRALLGHALAREVFSRARIVAPAVSLLGEVRAFSDLMTRVRAVGAPGSSVELRKEEGGLVVARALVTLSAERAPERR